MKLIKTSHFFATLLATNIAGLAFVVQPAVAQQAEQAESLTKPLSYTEVSAATAPIADAYFAAYIGHDWDALELLLTEDSSFQDPTARRIFGQVLSEGRTAMMERFRVGYASISHMEFVKNRHLISGETAIYEGALHWGTDLGNGTVVDSVTPMVVVLNVVNGKVTRHVDYVDYAPFVAAVRKSRSAAK